jgi:hypothetical protein
MLSHISIQIRETIDEHFGGRCQQGIRQGFD